jgi:hypothetical protein
MPIHKKLDYQIGLTTRNRVLGPYDYGYFRSFSIDVNKSDLIKFKTIKRGNLHFVLGSSQRCLHCT